MSARKCCILTTLNNTWAHDGSYHNTLSQRSIFKGPALSLRAEWPEPTKIHKHTGGLKQAFALFQHQPTLCMLRVCHYNSPQHSQGFNTILPTGFTLERCAGPVPSNITSNSKYKALLKTQDDCYSTHCQHKQKLKPKWARHYWRWCSKHHRGSKKSIVNSVVKKTQESPTQGPKQRTVQTSKPLGAFLPCANQNFCTGDQTIVSLTTGSHISLSWTETNVCWRDIPVTVPQKHLSPLHLP